MVNTYTGKAPRNARIKIDYTGESPSVQFKYPRKDGYVGSMLPQIYLIWAIIIALLYISFNIGASYEEFNNPTDNEEEVSLLKTLIMLLIFIVPPPIINKIFEKKLNSLFPVYQAWKTEKKYVTFKNKDIKISKINGKKEIYVEIPYFENIILNYEAIKDFSKYLTFMEIKEHNFKTEEDNGKKRSRKIKKKNEWYWNAKFYFSKIPKSGKLEIIFR